MLSQKNIYIYNSQTYLDGQKPPLEVTPCPDPLGSQHKHMGTAKSPAASATTPVLPQQ
jgi:hypothetical protein